MSDIYDLVIVGAGPIGCKLGELLGKNYKVLIIDKKSEIGKPVQCAGFNSNRILELSGVSKKVILNKITKSDFFSPNGTKMTFNSKRPFYVFNRELFDKEIAKKARKNNVEINLRMDFREFTKEKDFLKINTNKGKIKTKLLVGADGPKSTVSQIANLPQPDNLLLGIQKTVKGQFERYSSELWFGSDICPGFFAWLIPENEEWARIGLATSIQPRKYFEKFIKNRVGEHLQKKDNVAGFIRYGLIKNSVSDRVLLVGDAASKVKPFSGGGLIYGLIAARIAAKACRKSLEIEKYDHYFLKRNYEDKWREKLRIPITKGMLLNKIVYNSPDWVLDSGFWAGKYFTGIFEEIFDVDLL
jgi:geranylgeranyl reductase family protein